MVLLPIQGLGKKIYNQCFMLFAIFLKPMKYKLIAFILQCFTLLYYITCELFIPFLICELCIPFLRYIY